MRSLIIVAVMAALVCLAGCGAENEAPAEDPQPSTQAQEDPITEDNFESGETDGALKPADEDEPSATPEEPETP